MKVNKLQTYEESRREFERHSMDLTSLCMGIKLPTMFTYADFKLWIGDRWWQDTSLQGALSVRALAEMWKREWEIPA